MLVLRSARLFVGNRFFQYLFVCFLIYQNLETEKKGRSGISKMVKVKVGKKCAKMAQNVSHLKMKEYAGLCSSLREGNILHYCFWLGVFRHTIVCIGVSTPLFLAKTPFKSANCPSPLLFRQSPLYMVFREPPLKVRLFSESPKY